MDCTTAPSVMKHKLRVARREAVSIAIASSILMMLSSGVTMTDEENLQHYAPTVV